MTSSSALLAEATARLAAAGVGSPRVDAELLLAYCLGVPRSRLPLIDAIPADAQAAFAALLGRRAHREPLQHLVGHAPFRHLELAVGPGVFVPRPETELLVDAVLPALRVSERPVVVDLCAGSGALALAVADEVPAARVWAVERSPDALAWLRRNASGTDVDVVEADVADEGLLPDLRGQVDVVVCNPPYVPDPTPVEPEVRADPHEAVFGGPAGIDLMPAVSARAAELLRPGGIAAIEHDESHGATLVDLMNADGRWTEVQDHLDLTGRPRYVTATRAS